VAKKKSPKLNFEEKPKKVSGKISKKASGKISKNGKSNLNGKGMPATPPRPTRLIAMLLSLVTLVLAIQSVIHNDNWFFRIATQASLGLLMLLNAMEAILITKKRRIGLVLMAVSAVILTGMIFTFYMGKKTHAF